PFSPADARQAAFAFAGDVYEGLDAATLPASGLDWLQAHVRILSGLYGLLRPLDLMQPYRLEMSTKLANARGKDLYAFWGSRVAELLAADLASAKARALVNLASEEYFKVLKPASFDVPLIQPVFEDWKGGRYKVVSFFAKRARGLMARYAAERATADVEALKGFDAEDYTFDPAASDDLRWVFRRRCG
ncbi:MAG: peroxide stress protein YaaA, partial [Azospira sp.]|nr:peroxide stress protein YaaA [Azospira sp.]